MTNELKFNKITKIFFNNTNEAISVLLGIDASISSNKLNFVLGPSGSGKTTLLNIVFGKLLPTSGTIFLNDKKIISPNGVSTSIIQNIGLLKQNPIQNVWINLSIYENFKLIAKICKNAPDLNVGKIADEMLADLAIVAPLNKKVRYLSLGQIQRLGLGLILFKNPQIFLLDEPTSHLDFKTSKTVIELLQTTLNKGANKIFIITTHDQALVGNNPFFILYDCYLRMESMDSLFQQRHFIRRYYKDVFKEKEIQETKGSLDISGIIETECIITSKSIKIPYSTYNFLNWVISTKLKVEIIENSVHIQEEKKGDFEVIQKKKVSLFGVEWILIGLNREFFSFTEEHKISCSLNILSKHLILYLPIDD